jgi:hypothetical protein
MKSEDEIIDELLGQLDSSIYLKYDDVKNRGAEYAKAISRMRSLDFIQIQSIGHYGGHKYISLTSKGSSVVHGGGCRKYLTDAQEKEQREKEIYEYTKNTFGLTKRNTNWVIIGAIASIIAAIAAIVSIIK